MTSKELREKRAQAVNAAREILKKSEADNRDLNADEQKAWDAANLEIDNLGKRIERQDALDKHDRENAALIQSAEELRRLTPASAVVEPTNDGGENIPLGEAMQLAVQGWFYRNSDDDDVQELFTKRHQRAQKQTGIGRNKRMLSIPSGILNLHRRLGSDGATLMGHVAGPLQSIRNYRVLRESWRRGVQWDATEQKYVNLNPLTTLTGVGGGFLVPEGFSSSFETALLAYGYMLQVADVMTTAGAEPLPWPLANDTNNKGRMLNQNMQVDNTGASTKYPAFGAKMFYAYKSTSDEVLVPFELIRDNAVGLLEWLAEALGIRIGRIANDMWTFGTGTAQPTGIVTECLNVAGNAGFITTIKAATIQWDDLIELEHAVDPAYRLQGAAPQNANPRAGYMCHDLIVKAFRKLKDGEGRYLWQASANAGEPDKLNNRPLTRNQSMDSTTASGKNVLLFGELTKYKIRRVGQTRMYRLVERYRDNDQDAFLAFEEFDGGLIDAGTHPVKLLQMQ